MRSFLSVARPGVHDRVDRAVEAYEARFRAGGTSLERYWEGLGSRESSPSILAALVKADLQRRFRLDERPRAAEYLEKFPILAESGDRVVSLVYEEFCLLMECGADPDSREFCEGYGPWRDSLLSQLAYHRELSRAVGLENPPVKFPLPGEQFGKYQLHSILGRGGVAQVYLATEDDLGGRKVAIKVSAAVGQEPSIQGKLDHPNIVPILTVATSESGLRGICMPYRPGVMLEELIRRIGRGTPTRSSRAIWEALRPSDLVGALPDDELRSGWADFPTGRTFSEAVAWIGLALTNALSYLHGQGVLHRDIKPANILLAYREGPQLLDFNLSQDPGAAEHVNAAVKGGTLPYMAPEQLRAFLDPSKWPEVDAAADLYSLGLVLKELATGQPPELPPIGNALHQGIQSLLDRRSEPPASILETSPSLPPTLASIIEKCLAVDPVDRYEGASALATDLRLFLARRPLKHAPNPSRFERASNWLYRNRAVAGSVASLVLVLMLIYGLQPPSMKARIDRDEILLDSNRPGDVKKAAVELEKLRNEYPNSAWPTLYLSLALEKMGGEPARRANRLVQDACTKDDAEEALAGRLAKDPNSANLLTNLGIKLSEKKKLPRAREVLLRSLRVEPDQYVTLATLSDVEQKSGRFEEALQVSSDAVRVAKAKKATRVHLYMIHNGILLIFADLDHEMMDGPSRGRRRESEYLARFRAALESLQGAWENMNIKEKQLVGVENYDATVELYKGVFSSSSGVLAADLPDQSQATRHFDEAQDRFNAARSTFTTKTSDGDAVRKQVEVHQERLTRRRERHHLPSKTGLVASSDGKSSN